MQIGELESGRLAGFYFLSLLVVNHSFELALFDRVALFFMQELIERGKRGGGYDLSSLSQ